jgi:Ca2+-binding RTX toxin-like protein
LLGANGQLEASITAPTGDRLQTRVDLYGDTIITLASLGSGNSGGGAPVSSMVETSGNQTLTLGSAVTSVTLSGYSNTVKSVFGGVTISGDLGSSNFNLAGDNNTLLLGGYNDSVTLGLNSTGANTISGTLGNATIYTGDGDQSITAGGYNNDIATGDGNSTINAGTGNDNVTTGNGNNTITAVGVQNVITTGDGNNIITAGFGNDTVTVGNGSSSITVAGNQNVITTAGGSDTVSLTGGGWNNVIDAGDGLTIVTGGYATSYVPTALGSAGGLDVTDFNPLFGDKLDLTKLESTLGVSFAAFSGQTDAQDASALDIYVTPTGGSATLVATLHGTGAGATLAGLLAEHAIVG